MTVLTRKAAVLLGAAAALGLAALGTGSFGAAVGSAAMVLLFCVNALAAVPPRVEGRLAHPARRINEEETVRVDVALSNRARRGVVLEYRLELPDTFSAPAGAAGRIALGAGEEEAWTVQTRPHLFGPHALGPLRARLSDPSALRWSELVAAAPRRLMVYPRLAPIKAVPVRPRKATSFLGANEVPQPGDGFEFFTLREYLPGDSMRSINWRATARSTGLIVNQRQRESFQTVHVLLDATERAGDGQAVRSPYAVGARAAASYAAFCLKRADRVVFRLLTDGIATVHPGTPERQRLQVLDAIAGTRPHGAMRWREAVDRILPELRMHAAVVLVSSFETDPTVLGLSLIHI